MVLMDGPASGQEMWLDEDIIWRGLVVPVPLEPSIQFHAGPVPLMQPILETVTYRTGSGNMRWAKMLNGPIPMWVES